MITNFKINIMEKIFLIIISILVIVGCKKEDVFNSEIEGILTD